MSKKHRVGSKGIRKAYPDGARVKELVMLSAILLFMVSFYLVLPGAPSYFGDDIMYDGAAHSLLTGSLGLKGNLMAIESSMVVPIAVLYYILGYSYNVGILWDEISLMLAVIFTFFIIKRLYSTKAAFISSLLLGTFPILLSLSETAGNESPMVLFVTLMVLGAMYGLRKDSSLWMFVSGASTVAAVLASPLASIMSLFIMAYVVYSTLKARDLDKLKWFALGFIAVILLNSIYDWAFSGNPIMIVTSLTQFPYAFGTGNLNAQESIPYSLYMTAAFGVAGSGGSSYFSAINVNGYGLIFYALLFSAIFLLVKRRKWSYMLIGLLSFSILYMEFGPMYISLNPLNYITVYRSLSFLTLLSAPACIVIGGALAELLDHRRKSINILAIVFLIALFASAVYIGVIWHYSIYSSTHSQIVISDYLLSLNKTVNVYSTAADVNIMLYDGFSKHVQFHFYGNLNCSVLKPNTYVVEQPYAGPNRLSCPGLNTILNPYISKNEYDSSIVDYGYYITFYSELFYYGNNSTGQ